MPKKNLPKCPVNPSHTVIENTILNDTYSHCRECNEDVDYMLSHPRQFPKQDTGPRPLIDPYSNNPNSRPPFHSTNLPYGLYLQDNPHTHGSLVQKFLKTVFGLNSSDISRIIDETQRNGESLINSYSSRTDANRVLDQADHWLDVHEPNESQNRRRNLEILIKTN